MPDEQNQIPAPPPGFSTPVPIQSASAQAQGNIPAPPPGFGAPVPITGAASGTPDFSVGQALFGENTALGAPVQKEFATEASGVSDIFHGDVRQGLSKIWQSEAPHVIQGSPIEKLIQQVNPDFKGAVSPEQVADYNARKATAQPFINTAQFIDKQKHPVLKAINEAAQSLTSPDSIAILVGTG